MSDFERDLARLSSAEDFLRYFDIAFDAKVVAISRLHILKRCNQYLAGCDLSAIDDAGKRGLYRDCLARAYADFVRSTAQAEKVFPIFRRGMAFVPLSRVETVGTQR